jgi:hypothetical protein
MRRALFVALLLAVSTAVPAKLYKWVDEEGNVTYSERKPPDVQAEEIRVRVPAVTSEQAESRLEQLNERAETARKDREFKETYAAESAEREARLRQNCETARENLRILETAARVKDAEGNFIDDSQREARMQRARQDIEDNCD